MTATPPDPGRLDEARLLHIVHSTTQLPDERVLMARELLAHREAARAPRSPAPDAAAVEAAIDRLENAAIDLGQRPDHEVRKNRAYVDKCRAALRALFSARPAQPPAAGSELDPFLAPQPDDSSTWPKPPAAPQGSREATETDSARDDSARELIDAIAWPQGRDFRDAWDRACIMWGRFGAEPTLMRSPAPSGRAEAVGALRALESLRESVRLDLCGECSGVLCERVAEHAAALDAAQAQEGKRWQFEAADDAFGGAQAQEGR